LNDEIWLVSPYHTCGDIPADFPLGKDRKKNLVEGQTGLPFLGSCFMMKRENMERVFPIDDRLKIWCGDNYLYAMIAIEYGRNVKEIPESYIHHFCKATTKSLPESVLYEDKIEFEKIYSERRWDQRPKYVYTIPSIDLRLKLPIKELHKKKVLNVGVGDCTSGIARQLPYLNFGQLDHLEPHQGYIDNAKKLNWTCHNVNFIKGDVRDFDFSSYDFVMIFDVLEHLKKEESLEVISKFKNVFIFIPLENKFRDNPDGVKEQDHLSLWTEKDFRDLGFKTTLLYNFHSDAKGNRWSALWAIK